jgi:O-antigen/teichoic acid export membrane protein
MFKAKITEFRINVASGVTAIAISSILQIALAPIILINLGVETYGIWATLSIIMVVGAISDQGLGDSLTRSIARAWETQSFAKINEYFTAALIVALFISIIVITLIFQISEWIVSGLNIPFQHIDLSVQVLNALAVVLVLHLCQIVFNSLIIGIELIKFKNYIYIVARVTQFAFTIVFLYAGQGIWSLIYSLAIFRILSILLMAFVVNRMNKHNVLLTIVVKPSIKVFRRLKEIVKVGSFLFISRIMMLGLQPLLRAVLAREFGVTSVAYFDIANRVITMIGSVFMSAAKVVLPMASASDIKGLKSVRSIAIINRKFLLLSMTVGVILTGFVFWGAEIPLKLWLGEQYNEDILSYTKILIVSLLLNVTIFSHYNTLIGWGYTSAAVFTSLYSIVVFGLGLWVNWFFDYKYGVEGILFAYLAHYLGGSVYVYLTYIVKLNVKTKVEI